VTCTELRHRLESPSAFHWGLGIYALILALGLKRFVVWDQILVLEDASLWAVFSSFHPHALRWLVMQPTLAFGPVAPDAVFTVICWFLIWATTVLLARVGALAAAIPGREAALRIWLLLPLALATLTMNGRVIPAFAGLALLTAIQVEQAAGRPRRLVWILVGQAVGLLLMSVTSGTFAVGVIAVLAGWAGVFLARRHEFRKHRLLLPLIVPGALAVGGVCFILARKAVGFFHGDPLSVLDHGLGGQFLRLGAAPAIAGCLLTVLAAGLWAWRWPQPRHYGLLLRVPIAASAILGLVGYATLTTALPLLLLMGVLLIARE
jgi:hypothetical protein